MLVCNTESLFMFDSAKLQLLFVERGCSSIETDLLLCSRRYSHLLVTSRRGNGYLWIKIPLVISLIISNGFNLVLGDGLGNGPNRCGDNQPFSPREKMDGCTRSPAPRKSFPSDWRHVSKFVQLPSRCKQHCLPREAVRVPPGRPSTHLHEAYMLRFLPNCNKFSKFLDLPTRDVSDCFISHREGNNPPAVRILERRLKFCCVRAYSATKAGRIHLGHVICEVI